jgi:hypothetical protein
MRRARVTSKATTAIGLVLLASALLAIAVFLPPILLVFSVLVALPLSVPWAALLRLRPATVACPPASPPARPRGPPRS